MHMKEWQGRTPLTLSLEVLLTFIQCVRECLFSHPYTPCDLLFEAVFHLFCLSIRETVNAPKDQPDCENYCLCGPLMI